MDATLTVNGMMITPSQFTGTQMALVSQAEAASADEMNAWMHGYHTGLLLALAFAKSDDAFWRAQVQRYFVDDDGQQYSDGLAEIIVQAVVVHYQALRARAEAAGVGQVLDIVEQADTLDQIDFTAVADILRKQGLALQEADGVTASELQAMVNDMLDLAERR